MKDKVPYYKPFQRKVQHNPHKFTPLGKTARELVEYYNVNTPYDEYHVAVFNGAKTLVDDGYPDYEMYHSSEGYTYWNPPSWNNGGSNVTLNQDGVYTKKNRQGVGQKCKEPVRRGGLRSKSLSN